MKSRLQRIVVAAGFAYAATVGAGFGDGYVKLELHKWNQRLIEENWQVLLASSGTESLGVFLADPKQTDLNENRPMGSDRQSLGNCGIGLVQLPRTNFSSPMVPDEVVVSTSESRALTGTLDEFLNRNDRVAAISLSISKSKWDRVMTNQTTSLLYSSTVWGNPTARAALIKCVTDQYANMLTESKLTGDIEIRFLDKDGNKIKLSDVRVDESAESIFKGASKIDEFTLFNATVGLARRKGLCVNEAIFFRNSDGRVGHEKCKRLRHRSTG